jgi:hypothetical protein
VCLTQVEIYFVPFLAWEGFGQHILRCILCLRWHWRGLVNTCDTFCDLPVMGMVWPTRVKSILCPRTHVEINYVSLFEWKGVGQHMLRCILCPHKQMVGFGQHMLRCISIPCWLSRGFFNTFLDTFCVLAGMGVV